MKLPFFQKLSPHSSKNKSASKSKKENSSALLVGAIGTTLTRVSGLGLMEIDGQRYECFSRFHYFPKGATVKVVGKHIFQLLIEPAE